MIEPVAGNLAFPHHVRLHDWIPAFAGMTDMQGPPVQHTLTVTPDDTKCLIRGPYGSCGSVAPAAVWPRPAHGPRLALRLAGVTR